jgi:bis(5'-nucleosyl)-tetraphosphatase (symmetrical)
MPTYAIGDIQGCYDELADLLSVIDFNADRDRLWFVGDLVNRGPKSLAVLRRVHALGDNATVVLGNHDLHLLAVARSASRELRKTDTLDAILHAPDRKKLLDWLESRPLLHHDASLGYTMIHAGLAPQWDLTTARAAAKEVEQALATQPGDLYEHMYGNRPDRWSNDLEGHDRLRFIINCFTRLRFCDADGRLNLKAGGKPEEAPDGAVPWFQMPDRRSRDMKIVFGHWSALGLHIGNNVAAIDTGCVWGGSLCAWRLDQPAEPVQLSCRGYLPPDE